MISVESAREILDFSARMKGSPQRAEEQLHGAVAIHNLLDAHGVAYLADEVGMGKTLVALGAVALFRHFDPNFRVLFIAPKENIQRKWQKELRTFVGSNVRFADLRVRGFRSEPARSLVHCEGLLPLLYETALDPDRDFFARLTSFSLAMGKEDEAWARLRDQVRTQLPWLAPEALDARSKDNLARALCCALPTFDLVVVDEAHNLKHGFSDRVAARNRVLALAFGHTSAATSPTVFRNYGPRATRVLFLSATPVEESYEQLWNQLDVFGKGEAFASLKDEEIDDEEKKQIVAKFLVRRVTSLQIGKEERTKNQYRREWRRGGVTTHDEPIRIDDPRQRLTVALVQKKVTEIIGGERFGNQFQIGMLASFESFLETSKLKKSDDDASNFDDAAQSDMAEEREGADVRDINTLARSHREVFKTAMPHPKMDAIKSRLSEAWKTGRKALVFVRRVASVKELKEKLDESYNEWLAERMQAALPAAASAQFTKLVERFHKERREADDVANDERTDTLFSWFFRGEGPRGVVSGAAVARRFINQGSFLSTFFEDNHVATLLKVRPGRVVEALAATLGWTVAQVRAEIAKRGALLVGGTGKIRRRQKFVAAQGAAVQLLHELENPCCLEAQIVWEEHFHHFARGKRVVPDDLADALEWSTFFSELRERPPLRAALWPELAREGASFREVFREREQRAALLARAARLGHAFIDLYILLIQRLGTLEVGAVEDDDEGAADGSQIAAYLDLLESQQRAAGSVQGPWGAFHELSEIALNFDLILDLNLPEARGLPLAELPSVAGTLFGEQRPIGGMAGQVNQTVVRQFRMPGYPFVLVTTDLLQEGEDLHAFCSDVYHYGISWTPSAMEQRIGRIDRVRSQSERRLTTATSAPNDDQLLQVFFPHLEDTVEVLQVRRVLQRMNKFLRLMHEGLQTPKHEERRLDVSREMLDSEADLERITTRLKTAFPISPTLLAGQRRKPAVSPDLERATARFQRLRELSMPDLAIRWEARTPAETDEVLLGTGQLQGRQQPFGLFLRTYRGRLLVRCISPVGHVGQTDAESIKRLARELQARVCAVEDEDSSYDLTVEEDVLLGNESHDGERVLFTLQRVLRQADELEQRLLEVDEPLKKFADDLRGEQRGPHE